MHRTGFEIMECFGTRVPKFLTFSDSIYRQFLSEAEAVGAKLDPTEAELVEFENRWGGSNGILNQHAMKLEKFGDFGDRHAICERNAIEYVMDLLSEPIYEELYGLRKVFEMTRDIRVRLQSSVWYRTEVSTHQ